MAVDSTNLKLEKHSATSSDAVRRQVVEAARRLYGQAAPQPVNRAREFPS